MKKLVLVFLLFSVFSFAQTHRFFYEVQYKKDSTANLLTKEFYQMDINPDEVYFYGRDYYVLDSLMKNKLEMKFNAPPTLSNITSHKKGSNDYTEYELAEYDMYKMLSPEVQKWKLIDEKKKVGEYTYQKASTKWGGRNWIAWFTTEIPFQEGPFKFHGLPGLIMEIADDKGNFSYKLVKSQNFKETQPTKDYLGFFYQKAVPITWDKYQKMKLTNYNDPLSFMKNGKVDMEGIEGVFLKDGTKVTANNQKEVIAEQQKSIRRYNNPPDLSKVVLYERSNVTVQQ